MNKYYTYVYCDPRKTGEWITDEYTFKYEPFYIGKGSSDRFISHLKDMKSSYKSHKIQKILKEHLHPIILKIKSGISEEEALDLEKSLIKQLGTVANIVGIPRGPLTNLTAGGQSGTQSVESITKRANSLKGKKFSKERIEQLSAINKIRAEKSASLRRGKTLSDDTKNKISAALKGKAKTKPNNTTRNLHWIISFEDNKESINVTNLQTWCRENDITYSSLHKTLKSKNFYEGMKLQKCNSYLKSLC